MENNNERKEDNMDNIQMERILNSNVEYKYMFRINLFGNICVGKTSLLTRYTDNHFEENYLPNTVGVDFKVITLKYKDIVTKVHIWDTAGNERFKSITINYCRTSHGFIYVYDITNEESFDNLNMWIKFSNDACNTNAINFLVGNKSDLEEKRKISKEKAENFAKENDLIYLETSAKNNDNVSKLFEYFTYKLIKYFEKNSEKYISDDSDTMGQFKSLDIDDRKGNKCPC